MSVAGCAAVVVAAGSGERLGGDVPKALVPVGGRPLVAHAVERLADAGIAHIVVVHPAGARQAFQGVLADVAGLRFVEGADTRTGSVRAGLAEVADDVAVVAVHDAARGLQPAEVIGRAVAAVTGDVVAAAPATEVADTLKRVDGDGVVGTVDRTDTVAVQTPQVFRADVLRSVHRLDEDATDDLGLVERGLDRGLVTGRIVTVPGSPLGLKVTHPPDLVVASALLAATVGQAGADREEHGS